MKVLYLLGFFSLACIAPIAYQVDRTAQSLPDMEGTFRLPGLSAPVQVLFDEWAIPTIDAHTREDAYRTLGFLHARERLFQMDVMRRKASGRLAELFGEKAIPLDQAQRVLQFQRAARAIVASLPYSQKNALIAYTEGVNTHLQTAIEFSPEFRFLGQHPTEWRPEDSLLVALGMFAILSNEEDNERMLTVMYQCVPQEVADFLTPDSDEYTETLLGGKESWYPARSIPVQALSFLLSQKKSLLPSLSAVQTEPSDVGSNNWAVNASKTSDKRAIVANDMHLPLGLPNIWYRAHLRYGEAELSGVTLPGLPLMVVGSNRHIAWGFTNVDADVLDLVTLESDSDHPNQYRTSEGWKQFETYDDRILVKDQTPLTITLRSTIWGPVLDKTLLAKQVAIHWTALDPGAVNLALMEMDTAYHLDDAMNIMNRAGGPPQNVLLADDAGHIGWTYMGFFPRRKGFDGSTSLSWADGQKRWEGYISSESLPRVLDPPQGYLVTANNRLIGKEYPFPISRVFSNGYRAYRIRQQLASRSTFTEHDLFHLQLDTTSEFYEFYRTLALSLLEKEKQRSPELSKLQSIIQRWNGKLDTDSLGIGLLVRWRKNVAQSVFSPLVRDCAHLEPHFVYQWREQETPLRALLTERHPETVPDPRYSRWEDFLLDALQESAKQLQSEFEDTPLEKLPWGKINPIRMLHPFSKEHLLLHQLLDPPDIPGACNSFCIKVLYGLHGASERLVLSPSHQENGILHMPGGQSGHPFSPHYRDQQKAWQEGRPTPFLPGKKIHLLHLDP